MFTKLENYYEILGVSENASAEEIRKAYYQKAKDSHPDKISLTNLSRAEAECLFKKINEAHSTLSNPTKRLLYDLGRKKEITNSFIPKNTVGDFFRAFSDFDFPFESYASSFNHPFHEKAPASSDPTAANTEEMRDFIRKDEVDKLHFYLNKNQFNKTGLLNDLLAFAARQGSLSVVKYFIEERKLNPHRIVKEGFFEGTILKYAAGSGNLNLVIYLLEEKKLDIESQGIAAGRRNSALCHAVQKGHYLIVTYLIQKGAKVNPEVSNSDILNLAIESANLDIFKLLIQSGSTLTRHHLQAAFRRGHKEISQYILQIKPGLTDHSFYDSAIDAVLEGGNLELLQYLERNESLDISILSPARLLYSAAESGNKDLMRYLLEEKGLESQCHKHQVRRATLASAVEKERLGLVRFLMEEKGFTLVLSSMLNLVKENAEFKGIEINAYLQSYLPHVLEYRPLLLFIAEHGLAKLTHRELFNLYHLNIITKGKYSDFTSEIHYEIKSRAISDEEFSELLFQNTEFKIAALFYYSTYHYKRDLSRLQRVVESGVDLSVKNLKGQTVLDFAIHETEDTTIVDYLKAQGAKPETFKPNLAPRNPSKEQEISLKRVIEIPKPKTIAFAKELGGEIRHIPINEFEKIIGQTYCDKIDASSWSSPCFVPENITGSLSSEELKLQLEYILENSSQDLMIAKINDVVGYGVFALNAIPKNKVLTFYSGTIREGMQVKDTTDHAMNYFELNLHFSTKLHRGISSFLQDLPTPLSLADPELFFKALKSQAKKITKNELMMEYELYSLEFKHGYLPATANIRQEYIFYAGIPMVLLVTDRAIEAGEPLGIHYGFNYWLSRGIVKELFDKKGHILSPSGYRRTFYQLKFENFNYTGEFSPLIEQLKQGEPQIQLIDEQNQVQKIAPSLVLKQLLLTRGINKEEYQLLKQRYQSNNNAFFKSSKRETENNEDLKLSIGVSNS